MLTHAWVHRHAQDKEGAVIAQKKISCLEHPEDLTWNPRVRRGNPPS